LGDRVRIDARVRRRDAAAEGRAVRNRHADARVPRVVVLVDRRPECGGRVGQARRRAREREDEVQPDRVVRVRVPREVGDLGRDSRSEDRSDRTRGCGCGRVWRCELPDADRRAAVAEGFECSSDAPGRVISGHGLDG